MSSLASLMKLASLALCLLVTASFVLFAVNRTSSASQHQQQQLAGEPVQPSGRAQSGVAGESRAGESSLRRTIDDLSEAVTSPFAGLTDGSGSQWLIRGVDLLLALLVYGLGLGFVARSIRVNL